MGGSNMDGNLSRKEKKILDMQIHKFVYNASYLELQCFQKYLPMTDDIRLKIIDRMEALECDMLLQKFLADYRKNE